LFSATVEYALLAMVQLASENSGFCTTQQIAKKTRVSLPYLSKVFQLLARAGLVTSRRGKHGGIKLAKPANRISLLDVVVAVAPMNRSIEPLNGLAKSSLRRLEARLDGLMQSLRKELATVSLADACAAGGRAKKSKGSRGN
jgi:Rrf2 family transcriptional regulator, nitric oxide-sensitive transcriptional repressor